MKIALATTVLHPGSSFKTWVEYHARLFDVLYIFFDQHDEMALPTVPMHPKLIRLPGSQKTVHPSPISNNMIRQNENIQKVIEFCLAQGIDWLCHIDLDELVFAKREDLENALDIVPNIGLLTLTNHEAIPVWASDNMFRECHSFKVNGTWGNWDYQKYPHFFLAYINGKSIVRVTPGIEPNGPHDFIGFQGRHCKDFAYPFLLHYPNATYQDWLAKYENLGHFSEFWYDDPNNPITISFYSESRDVYRRCVESGDFSEAEAFFQQLILPQQDIEWFMKQGNIMQLDPLKFL